MSSSLVADYSDSEDDSCSNNNTELSRSSSSSGPAAVASDLNPQGKKSNSKNDNNVNSSKVHNTTNSIEQASKSKHNLSKVSLLLPGADSSSSESCSDDDGDGVKSASATMKKRRKEKQSGTTTLDNPFRTFGDVNIAKEDSVFRNPFREKEEERIAVLEKHVKMTENPETALTINGKKICWNYRKRKCYLGTQCPYAHDSDVPLTEEQLKEQKLESDLQRSAARNSNSIGQGNAFNATGNTTAHLPGTASVIAGGYDSSAFFSSPHLGGNDKRKGDVEDVDEQPYKNSKSKKRVGLTNSLIPSKKALNLYQKTKEN